MIVKFDKPSKGSNGKLNNTGSSAAFVSYLDKEDSVHLDQGEQPEHWFSPRHECPAVEVRATIDHDRQGMGKDNTAKFSTGSISPTAQEWQALGGTEEERREAFREWIAKDFSKDFAENYDKHDTKGNPIPIDLNNISIFYKIEDDRHFTGRDREVIDQERKQGEIKPGFNLHCHFIIATKTADGKHRINPNVNSQKEFSRVGLKERVQQSFDHRTGYDRQLKDSFEYMNAMKNGTLEEKIDLIQRSVAEEMKRETPEKEQTRTPEQEPPKEQEQSRGYELEM